MLEQGTSHAPFLGRIPSLNASSVASQEGNKVISGGADNSIRMFDVSTSQSSQIGQHEAPVKCVKWVDAPQPAGGLLASGSWDKTIKASGLIIFGCDILTRALG